ncbi:hypothetical protein [Oceanobacillus halotolerans]|uniref:hypothetical protein n=1 Tax=Oceanobacillus halotolerans TaxID=2663380 RepID=UPI0013DB003B|nr:hypothetical protein [Oceanobacillus halotolerans]
MESSGTVVNDYTYNGVRLQAGQTYTTNWNRTIPLGSLNRAASVGIMTISGSGSSYACGTEVWQTWHVGARSLTTINDSPVNEVSNNVLANKKEILAVLSNDYQEAAEPMTAGSTMVSHFSDIENGNLVIVTQQEDPIQVNNVEEEDFVSKKDEKFHYEYASFNNYSEQELSIIKYKKDDIYTSIVSILSEQEIVDIAKETY